MISEMDTSIVGEGRAAAFWDAFIGVEGGVADLLGGSNAGLQAETVRKKKRRRADVDFMKLIKVFKFSSLILT